MDEALKQRLIGAIVIIGLAVIFVPIILDRNEDPRLTVKMDIPERPVFEKQADFSPPVTEPIAEVTLPQPVIIPESKIIHEMPEELAAKAKAAQSPAVTAVAKESWVVQLGSFSQKANADKLVDKLKLSDNSVYAEKVGIPGGYTYRVRIGPFVNRDQAIGKRRQIKKQYHIAGVVMSEE